MESGTTVVGLNFGQCGYLSCESRLTDPDNGKVVSNNFEKRLKLYENVWLGFSGDSRKISELQGHLPGMLHRMLPVPTSFWQMGVLVSHCINLRDPPGASGGVQAIMIGSVNSKSIEMLSIMKDTGNRYHPKWEPNVASIGSGAPVVQVFISSDRRGFNSMTIDEARKYAGDAVWSAIQRDWYSGGRIRVTCIIPGQPDTSFQWVQQDESNCANDYYGPYPF